MVSGFAHHTAVLSGPEIVGYVVINHRGPAKMVALPTQYKTVIFATMEAYDQANLRNFVFNRSTPFAIASMGSNSTP